MATHEPPTVARRMIRVAIFAAAFLAAGGAVYWARRDFRRFSVDPAAVSAPIPIASVPPFVPVLAGNPAPSPSATSAAAALRARYGPVPARTKRGDGELSIVVTVHAAEGVSVLGAAVSVVARTERGAPCVARDFTDASGRARLEGLRSDGAYDLIIVPAVDDASAAPERIEGWSAVPMTVVLRRAALLEGKVVDAGDRAVPGSMIAVRDSSGTHGVGVTDAHGAFRIGQLRPGPLELAAQFGDVSSDWLRLDLVASQTSNVVLRIGGHVAGLQVRGWTAALQSRAFLTPELGHDASRQEIALDGEGAGVVRLGSPEARYVLWVPAATGTVVVYERDLVLDRTLSIVSPRRALDVSGRALVDGAGVPARVALIGPGLQITTRADHVGAFRIQSGTTQGVFLLADYSKDGVEYSARQTVTDSGDVVLTLERKGTVR